MTFRNRYQSTAGHSQMRATTFISSRLSQRLTAASDVDALSTGLPLSRAGTRLGTVFRDMPNLLTIVALPCCMIARRWLCGGSSSDCSIGVSGIGGLTRSGAGRGPRRLGRVESRRRATLAWSSYASWHTRPRAWPPAWIVWYGELTCLDAPRPGSRAPRSLHVSGSSLAVTSLL